MSSSRKLVVLAENIVPGEPSLQLLDRLLSGYPAHGSWRPPKGRSVTLHAPAENWAGSFELNQRVIDLGLRRNDDLVAMLREAEAAVSGVREQTPVFVYGSLANELGAARRIVSAASERNIPLAAGTALSSADTLPPNQVPDNAPMKEALVVVQGSFGAAEHAALNCLLPQIERRQGGEAGVNRVYPTTARYSGASRARAAGPASCSRRHCRALILLKATRSRTEEPRTWSTSIWWKNSPRVHAAGSSSIATDSAPPSSHSTAS